jgi:hypothetical protein
MTGNTLTMNPNTGTNAYVNGTYGTTPQGFWGNVSGFGGNTPFGFGTQAFQPTVPINTMNPFTSQMIQQPGFIGQATTPWQAGFINSQFGTPQVGYQGILNSALQTTPPQVLNTILQTTPPQVLPYILNALACQQTCQQVLAQNPHAVLGINPLTITQPFLASYATNQGQFGFGGNIGGFGINTTPFVGTTLPQLLQQGSCAGCVPGMQQWGLPTVGFQGGFGQVVPQQPWFNNTYGTW